MDDDGDGDWDPLSDAEDPLDDDGFTDDHDNTPLSVAPHAGLLPLLLPDMTRAAARIFSVPELFEAIVVMVISNAVTRDTRSQLIAPRFEPLQAICLRHINSSFHKGITASPKLRRLVNSWEQESQKDIGMRGSFVHVIQLLEKTVENDFRAHRPVFWLFQHLLRHQNLSSQRCANGTLEVHIPYISA